MKTIETKTYTFTPEVDPTHEFIEIAYDFSNPLDIVREAISNAFDAYATKMNIYFNVIQQYGEALLVTEMYDNGVGMGKDELKSFFDLGNSTRRDDETAIGEKGHGTKVYLNSKRIEVETINNGIKYTAIMDNPIRDLHNGITPTVEVSSEQTDEPSMTKITVYGYNNNRQGDFTHHRLKDYILWFTKIGSIEKEFSIMNHEDFVLRLKGLDFDEPETINFGHVFPKESKKVSDLFTEHSVDAPKWYCKRIEKTGFLDNSPYIKYHAVFYIEGSKVKYSYNEMIRRSGRTPHKGAYQIQERYGLWLCKDFIPIQRKNEWITQKGSEYTKFHAFFNCQGFRLTANRGSIENTPSEILEDIKNEVVKIFNEILNSDDWNDIEWLEGETEAYNTVQREEKDFASRCKKVLTTEIADYNYNGNSIRLVSPSQENGVFSMFMQLSAINPNLFPFIVVDYNTHIGIDVIVKENLKHTLEQAKLYYVEFKYILRTSFNHSFKNLRSIVCWDISPSLKHGDIVEDVGNNKRVFAIIPPENENDRTRYFLDDSRSINKIEVFVLKNYLREVAGITFRPRTAEDKY